MHTLCEPQPMETKGKKTEENVRLMADAGTFCTTAEVGRKAGENCSATSKAEAYTNQYVKEIEGYIMTACRYDLKTNYATLNTETKELLREATSSGAAIYVIQYDMSGFTSRTEAELMMNVLKMRLEECVELLKDQKTITYGKS